MRANVTLEMDGDTIRFTPDGKISVLDAIGALSPFSDSDDLWNWVASEKPAILQYCQSYPFENEEAMLVVDSQGWDIILTALADRLLGDGQGWKAM